MKLNGILYYLYDLTDFCLCLLFSYEEETPSTITMDSWLKPDSPLNRLQEDMVYGYETTTHATETKVDFGIVIDMSKLWISVAVSVFFT